MINVCFTKDKRNLILKVDGHAGMAEKGQDIVCASASILAYTVAQIVTTLQKQDKLKKKPTIEMHEGDALIVCKPRRDAYAETLHTYSVAQIGFALLEKNFPEYVKLTRFGTA